MAIFVALLFIILLPASPRNPRSLLFPKFSFFSEHERRILLARVHNDDAAKKASHRRLSIRGDVIGTLGNWRVWPHVLIATSLIAPTSAMGTYTPSLIKSFKFPSESVSLEKRRDSQLHTLANLASYSPASERSFLSSRVDRSRRHFLLRVHL
jgi:hypothetical protein